MTSSIGVTSSISTLVKRMCAVLKSPADWIPGSLLHVQRYTNGSFRVTKLEDQDKQTAAFLEFDSTVSAQGFISWWYAPPMARVEGEMYGPEERLPKEVLRLPDQERR